MKDRKQILEHLEYSMQHVDGLCWFTAWFLTHRQGGFVERRKHFQRFQFPLAVAEAGLINYRKLLEFVGLKLNSGKIMNRRKFKSDSPDCGIEDLGLALVSPAEFGAAPFAVQPLSSNLPSLLDAAAHTLRAASKGAAHFTTGVAEGARAEYALPSGRALLWIIEQKVYAALPIPNYKSWTG